MACTAILCKGDTSDPNDPSNSLTNLRRHPCFVKYAKEPVVLITSFNANWYNFVYENNKDKPNPWAKTILETTFHYPLIVYHEEDIPDIPNICKVDLREELPWLNHELMNETSGLNRYFNLSSFFDPCTVARKGYTKVGHALMLKVASINHAVHAAVENTVVFWVDTDVTFREIFPDFVQNWLAARDVTYIPFFLGKRQNFDHTRLAGQSSRTILKSDERWRLETGLFALTSNERTKLFTAKALSMYRGGMYHLAQACFRNADFCIKQTRVKYHVFLNDIFVFALLIHSDLHEDSSIFNVHLRHGVFAMGGLAPWGPRKVVWGARAFQPLFHPLPPDNTTDIVTPFHIGKYIFHHFGYSERGVLSVQSRRMNNNYGTSNASAWRKITDPGDESKSLVSHLEVPYMG